MLCNIVNQIMRHFIFNKIIIISEMNKREIDWSGKEEGEAELLCYECGADFRTRSYFLRHRRAHRNAEICGMLMTEDSWRGMVGNDSDTEGGGDALKEHDQHHRGNYGMSNGHHYNQLHHYQDLLNDDHDETRSLRDNDTKTDDQGHGQWLWNERHSQWLWTEQPPLFVLLRQHGIQGVKKERKRVEQAGKNTNEVQSVPGSK